MDEIALLAKKLAYKEMEEWLYTKYAEIDQELSALEYERAESKRDELREDGVPV